MSARRASPFSAASSSASRTRLLRLGDADVIGGKGGLGRGKGVQGGLIALGGVFPAERHDRAAGPLNGSPTEAGPVQGRLRHPPGAAKARRVALAGPKRARAPARPDVPEAPPREAEARERDSRLDGDGGCRGVPGSGDRGGKDGEDDPGDGEKEEGEG